MSFLTKLEKDMGELAAAMPTIEKFLPEVAAEVVKIISGVKTGSSVAQDVNTAVSGAATVAGLVDPAAAPLAAGAAAIVETGIAAEQAIAAAAK